MRYFSTFTGIGGFELGIERAYENIWLVRTERQIDSLSEGQEAFNGTGMGNSQANRDSNGSHTASPICIGYSEIDKYATQVYQHHFPEHKNYGDITTINATELPDFDLFVGGFPCQSFSIAGKRKGFEDTRGTLFFDIARILRAKQPRLFLLENVKGLLSHDNGNTFKTIISTLDELGYDLQWQVLNSKNHGVPQNRERVFIIGHLRGTHRPQVFPFGTNDCETTNVQGHVANTLTARYYGAEATGTYIEESELNAQIQQLNNPTHSDRTVGAPTAQRIEINENGTSNTLTSVEKDNLVLGDTKIRRLTPFECERLQGFPDNWTAVGTNGQISDTQRYKMCGNAVTVNVIKDICERLLR